MLRRTGVEAGARLKAGRFSVAAEAGGGGFPGFAQKFFFGRIQVALGVVHAAQKIMAAHEQAQNVPVNIADRFQQGLAGAGIGGVFAHECSL